MAPDETTSGAAPSAQEQPTERPQGGADETSQAKAAVQEQRNAGQAAQDTPAVEPQGTPPEPHKTPDEVAELRRQLAEEKRIAAERIAQERQNAFREAQSRFDKLQHEREVAAEKERLAGLDDEDYGKYMRQKAEEDARKAAAEAQRQQADAQAKIATVNAQLERISDPEIKADLHRRVFESQEFKSYEAVLDAIGAARENIAAKKAAEAEQRRWEREGRPAADRDAAAALAETVSTPVLGSGTPSGSNTDKLHGHAATEYGVAKAFSKRK